MLVLVRSGHFANAGNFFFQARNNVHEPQMMEIVEYMPQTTEVPIHFSDQIFFSWDFKCFFSLIAVVRQSVTD